VARIVARAGGNTFYLEELIRQAAAGDPGKLPDTVLAMVQARLEALPADARRLLRAASTFGAVFWAGAVDALLVGAHVPPSAGLPELAGRELVRRRDRSRFGGEQEYAFRHALIREAAYAMLTDADRATGHRLAAEWLERAGETEPLIIAEHYERAGLAALAVQHLLRAALVARRLHAPEDALALLGRGRALLERLPAGQDRDTQELELELALCAVHRHLKGWTSPESERGLERARALCDRVGDDAQRASVLVGLQSLYLVQARFDAANAVFEELERLGQRDASFPRFEAAVLHGSQILHQGGAAEASAQFERVMAGIEPEHLAQFLDLHGWSCLVHGRAFQAHALWLLGRPDAALASGLEAVRVARELGQPFSQALAATYLAVTQELRADHGAALAQAEDALAITTRVHAPYYRAWSAIMVAHARARARADRDAVRTLRDAIAELEAGGAELRLPYYLGFVAEACGRAALVDEGLAAVHEALAESHAHGETWWDAELHRLRGELLVAGGGAAEAEPAFLGALEIARAQEARSLELRAAISLARLRPDQAAAATLADVYRGFSDGGDTPDLRAARELLGRLGARR
jgi:predicted ATPase